MTTKELQDLVGLHIEDIKQVASMFEHQALKEVLDYSKRVTLKPEKIKRDAANALLMIGVAKNDKELVDTAVRNGADDMDNALEIARLNPEVDFERLVDTGKFGFRDRGNRPRDGRDHLVSW
jgi:hypothetical protein